jgi:diguanylate cyclase (GGDEF)-like protein/PAS domain S-box-containing protein
MENAVTQVLLVEDDLVDAERIERSLTQAQQSAFHVERTQRLGDALDRLGQGGFDVVLLDLTLPDCEGIEVFDRVLASAPDALILILSTSEDEALTAQAIQHGAHDYLVKNRADPHWVPRALRHARERKATELGLRQAEEALFEEKERAEVTLNSIGDCVLATDLAGNLTYLNLEAERMSGWPRQEALGRPMAEIFSIIHGTTRKPGVNPALRAIEENRSVGLAADSVLIRRDGSEMAIEDSAAPIHNREGRVCGAVIVFHDVSLSRAMAQRMAHLAQHDPLTELPNRLLLMDRLSLAIGLAHRHHKRAALLFLDLDDFKGINDSLGHAIGDRLLQAVADRLVAEVRESDTVCRQGGDEFVILLAEIEQRQDAALVAEKLLRTVSALRLVADHPLQVTLSICIGIYPDDGLDRDALMKNADTAMYQAKACGANNYQFFDAAWVRTKRG